MTDSAFIKMALAYGKPAPKPSPMPVSWLLHAWSDRSK